MFDHAPMRRGDYDRDSHDGCDICAAYALGRDDAQSAASWVADGNTDPGHIRRVLTMLEDGDPAADAYLPAWPDLSGEWADARTPQSLFSEVTGLAAEAGDADGEVVDSLADAYTRGVDETFLDACETALRKWLPEDAAPSQLAQVYAVSAVVERDTSDGYRTTVQLPTFYLFADVQGITSEAGALAIATRMFTDLGHAADDVHVCAVATSFGAHS